MFETFAGVSVWTGFTRNDRPHDSDILIEVSRGRNADVVSRWINLSNSDAGVLYSPVSVAELWADMYSNRPRNGTSGGRLPEAIQTEPWGRGCGRVDWRKRGGEQSRTVDAKPQALPDEGGLLLRLSH